MQGYVVFCICWLLMLWPTATLAHHGNSGGLGGVKRQASTAVPPEVFGQTNSRFSLSQSFFRVRDEPDFDDPIGENSLFGLQEIAGAFSWAPWGELSLTLPWLFRTSDDQQSKAGLGDVGVETRLIPWSSEDKQRAIFLGTQLSFPTGSVENGFGTGEIGQRINSGVLVDLAASGWLLSMDAGFAWSYISNTQLAVDYSVSLGSAPLYLGGRADGGPSMRVLLGVEGRTFLRDSAVRLDAFPAQSRNQGDSIVVVDPGLSLHFAKNWLLFGSASVPVTRSKNAEWRTTLSLQYWLL